jgi:hypothetical protein
MKLRTLVTAAESPLVLCLLVVSVATNVLLTREVRAVKSTPYKTAFAEPGTRVPALVVTDLDNQATTIPYDTPNRKGTVIYALSPTCHWCARNVENIKALYKAKQGEYNFVALSVSDANIKEYANRVDLGFPMYLPSEQTRRDYHLRTIPQTIVVGRDSVVLRNWAGAYQAQTASEIAEYFNTRLPGLLPESVAADVTGGPR